MDIKKVGCIGAGLIGQSWATLFAWKGYDVNIHDLSAKTLEDSLSQILDNLDFLAKSGLLEKDLCEKCFNRVKIIENFDEFIEESDYIQESVYESYKVKKNVFKSMDEIAKRDIILASSSSTLNMTVIQKVTNKPDRCVVAHPWNPPHLMPLVEIIPGRRTSLECIKRTKDFMNKLSRVPIVQKKAIPGTIGNRLAAALWREAIDLVYKGVVEVEDIDKAVSAGPGIRWAILGPHLSYHLGGGKGGIEYYLDHLGPAMERRWKSLASWTSIPPLAKSKIIQGIKDTKITKELSVDEVKKIRDRKLIELLKILYTNS